MRKVLGVRLLSRREDLTGYVTTRVVSDRELGNYRKMEIMNLILNSNQECVEDGIDIIPWLKKTKEYR